MKNKLELCIHLKIKKRKKQLWKCTPAQDPHHFSYNPGRQATLTVSRADTLTDWCHNQSVDYFNITLQQSIRAT